MTIAQFQYVWLCYLEGIFTSTTYPFSKTIAIASSLGLLTLAMTFWLDLKQQTWIPSFEVGIKYNQKTIG